MSTDARTAGWISGETANVTLFWALCLEVSSACLCFSHRLWSMGSPISPVLWPLTPSCNLWLLAPSQEPSKCILSVLSLWLLCVSAVYISLWWQYNTVCTDNCCTMLCCLCKTVPFSLFKSGIGLVCNHVHNCKSCKQTQYIQSLEGNTI